MFGGESWKLLGIVVVIELLNRRTRYMAKIREESEVGGEVMRGGEVNQTSGAQGAKRK
jgi:hypothetical protein